MKRHILSFVKSPLGYVANFVATASCYLPVPAIVERAIAASCETLCLRDGVQDDMMF